MCEYNVKRIQKKSGSSRFKCVLFDFASGSIELKSTFGLWQRYALTLLSAILVLSLSQILPGLSLSALVMKINKGKMGLSITIKAFLQII